ncbi:NAD(P)-dependent oxidoreductase [Alphaproteobacteria bacterium]|nr:NAD(P)-dependent oxidoreductase [Alphaproteobacteria bacterium]
MKILVTGGLGFVGVHLIKDLQKKFCCTVLDNEFVGQHRKKLLVNENYDYIKCDISKEEEVLKVFKENKFDIIIHLAAKHLIPWCERNNAEAYRTNVVGTLNILNNLDANTKIIFISSAAVYGSSKTPLIEDKSNLQPFDVYGLTKLHGETIITLKAKQRSLNYTIIRLFNVIGPYESNSHILPDICYQLKEGKKIIRLGNTASYRDFIGTKDVSKGILKILDIPNTNQIINLCSGLSYSMDEIIEEVRKVSGINFDIAKDPLRQRTSDNPFVKGSIKKLQNLTGWTPTTTLNENIRSVWKDEWTHKNWSQVIK